MSARPFGPAIVAALLGGLSSLFEPTVADALTQNYAPTVAVLATITTTSLGAVSLGGYYNVSDGGGGMLLPGAPGCTPNGATIFTDAAGNCLYRATTTNNVREWGAHCDVVAIQSGSNATWDPTLGSHGALVVKKTLLNPAPPVSTGGQYIAISQIGGPTLWGSSSPAVWATRFSALGGTQVNYKAGDLISFMSGATSGNHGSFSQQIAIIVDAVDSTGAITQSHFLWGGLYDPTAPMDATFTEDDGGGRSYCANTCGTMMGQANGATFTPAWSGWSLLNSQQITGTQALYLPGDTITLDGSGSTVNQGHYAKLVVENVSSGVVTAFDWLDYGSYATLPTNPMTLSQTSTMRGGSSGPGTGFSISPVAWTRGPFVSKIDHTAADTDTTKIDIFLTDKTGAFPTLTSPPLAVQYFYYGSDDGTAIDLALGSQSASSMSAVNGNAIVLPGACGTTIPITLPQDTTANFANPALVGGNFQSTGLYAFAHEPGSRSPPNQVLNRIVYGGLLASTGNPASPFGGGLANMLIEGLGIPEGYGYYGLFPSGANQPSGYAGPTTPPNTTPSAGDLIEIDSGKYIRIANLHVTDGGIGSGNSIFHCGIDESNPGGAIKVGGAGNLIVSDSRFDGNSTLSGATNPDFSLRLGNSFHDSVYKALSVYDGTTADILQYNGNLFSQIHLNSDAGNSGVALLTVPWIASNTGLAGVANFGFYALGNTSIAQTQCDIANLACIRLLNGSGIAGGNPAQITDTQMKCGSLVNVPSIYYGVWLGAGTVDATVSGTAAPAQCNVPGAQLVQLDGPVDSTVSLCNNSNATAVSCGGGSGLAAGRWYTQPASAYTPVTLSGAAAPATTTLYAVPFINPSGGVTTQMGIQVTGAVSMKHCELGVYSSIAGAPGSLLLDAGQVSATSTGPSANTNLHFVVEPNTLYFLAIGCEGNVGVEGTSFANGLTGVLFGLPDFITAPNSNVITTSWVYALHGLPAAFGAPTYSTAGGLAGVPNVYVGP